jgi:23S rRNA (pseudouridine1915-N3)-methyltransferase
MKVIVLCVGRPRGAIAEAVAEYEKRAGRYFNYEAVEVREEPFRGQSVDELLEKEGARLLARLNPHSELVALHRPGKAWSSAALSAHLSNAAVSGVSAVTFALGGAFGLADSVLSRANHLLSLSAMTLPHELARLLLAEQLYRAGTIARNEPYHKGPLG